MTDSDSAWIERFKQGDEEALTEFIKSRERQLLSFIQKNLSDALKRKVEPSDILQEVTISALGSMADVDWDQREPFGWLCRLAERRIIDAHRRYLGAQKRSSKREVRLQAPAADASHKGLIDLLVASMTTPSQAFARNQREYHLNQALEKLPQESRDALRLRYVEQLPTKEIAEQLGKSHGAVRVMLSRSLSKLQSLLGGQSLFESFQTPPPPE